MHILALVGLKLKIIVASGDTDKIKLGQIGEKLFGADLSTSRRLGKT